MGHSDYIGRFAPSPSGPLHLGSLMSATCSYLQARSQQGQWKVRIEDVDTPRVVKGMADLQLKQLEAFGFEWDGAVLHQSTRLNAYNNIIQQLIKDNKIYACECSRNTLKQSAQSSEIGFIYPQNCRNKNLSRNNHALRIKTPNHEITFHDAVYAEQRYNIQNLSSDWVIKRNDSIIAYHLAVVADDALQGITEIVRGVDLLALTPLHIALQKQLKYPTPKYCHHPLIKQNGKKLSKQNHAPAVELNDKIKQLNITLNALGQAPIEGVSDVAQFWQLAIKQWNVALIPQSNQAND